jgi:DNA-binding transcriptional LysR family regulator
VERELDIEDLQTFVEVADAGGVSPAARRLGVSKSIVSRRLFRLEADLGVQLVARTTRGAALTEAGTTFRDHAARVCAEIDIARETILPAGDLRGRLRIAAPLSFGPTVLAPVFAELGRPRDCDDTLSSPHGRTLCRPAARTAPCAKGSRPY